MIIDSHSAVVDNDFIGHISEAKISDSELISALHTAFSNASLTGVVHPLVFNNEVQQNNPRVKLLFANKLLYVASFDDIFQCSTVKKRYYIKLVKDFFHWLTGESFPVVDGGVLTYWVRRKSLGEVHSTAMCIICGCGIFLSDDQDSVSLANHIRTSLIGDIQIYDRKQFFDGCVADGQNLLPRKIVRSLTHAIRDSWEDE